MIWIDPGNAFAVAFAAGAGWALGAIAIELLRRLTVVTVNRLIRWALGGTPEEGP